jgi:hypothetical protein
MAATLTSKLHGSVFDFGNDSYAADSFECDVTSSFIAYHIHIPIFVGLKGITSLQQLKNELKDSINSLALVWAYIASSFTTLVTQIVLSI